MCDCEICRYNREFRAHIAKVPAESQAFFRGLLDNFLEVSHSLDYNKSLVDGTHPHADRIIERRRARKKT